jgi:hypothetical protein
MAKAWIEVDIFVRSARIHYERGNLPAGTPFYVPAMPDLERYNTAYEAMVCDLTAGKRRQRTPADPPAAPDQSASASAE